MPLSIALIGDRVEMAQRQVALEPLSRGRHHRPAGRIVLCGAAGGDGSAGAASLPSPPSWSAWPSPPPSSVSGERCRAGRFDLRSALLRYRDILSNPRALTLFSLVFVEAIAIFGIFPYVAPLLEERGGGGATEAGFAIGGFAIGGLVYSVLVTWMLRRLGIGRILMGGGFFAGAALIVLGLGGDWKLDAAALLLMGLGFYMLHNTFQAQVTEVAPGARASAVALHAFSFFCGQALGVVLWASACAISG